MSLPSFPRLWSSLAVTALLLPGAAFAEQIRLLNVSYDPTRELYTDYNQAFSQWYEQQSGDRVSVQQSHGGSGRQARSVIEGNPADIVTPSVSILTQPPVAVVEDNVKKKGPAAEKAAHAYLEHLYSPEGQRLVARHYYRPINPDGVDPELLEQFPAMDLYNINEVFGGWNEAQQTHFANGGVFDRITRPEQ